MLSFRSLAISALLAAISLIALPQASQAQLAGFNLCTIYQQSPQTEDARSTLTEEWENDSWESLTRTIVSYEGGNPTEVRYQQRDQSGAWSDTARAQGDFDSSDRITQCTFQQKESGSFVNSFRTNFSYNDNGRLDVETSQVWETSSNKNPNRTWVNASRSSYTYDNSGNVTQRVDETWNRNSGEWVNSARIQRTYDSQDRLTEELREIPDGSGGWMNNRRTQNTYGSNGITETLIESWDALASTWQNEERSQFSYPNSDTVEEILQTWDGSTWVNEERTTTTLNDNDLPTMQVTEDWDGSNWVNSSRSETSYTTHNGIQKVEQIVTEEWNESASGSASATGNVSAGEWENSHRITFSYTDVIPVELARFDARRDGEKTVLLTWKTASETNNSGFSVQRQIDSETSWTKVRFVQGAGTTSKPQSYRFRDRTVPYEAETVRYRLKQVDLDGTTHFSKEVEVSLGAPEQLALHAPFPSPTRDHVTVRYEVPEGLRGTDVQIALYDVLGRRVATLVNENVETGRNTVTFTAGDLPTGTYFVWLQADGQTRSQRLTVVK